MSPNPALQCPRDGAELIVEHMHGIEVDHCGTCNGRWLDHHELDDLEATKADEAVRRGTIRYSERDSDLSCPVCGEQMAAFNYRAYDLELDTCHRRARLLARRRRGRPRPRHHR